MTKREVLNGFAQIDGFISPDELRSRLGLQLDRRSFYSYLIRLSSQGLLERAGARRGQLAYRLTRRGQERLAFFMRQR